jgi:hypothetical protein
LPRQETFDALRDEWSPIGYLFGKPSLHTLGFRRPRAAAGGVFVVCILYSVLIQF